MGGSGDGRPEGAVSNDMLNESVGVLQGAGGDDDRFAFDVFAGEVEAGVVAVEDHGQLPTGGAARSQELIDEAAAIAAAADLTEGHERRPGAKVPSGPEAIEEVVPDDAMRIERSGEASQGRWELHERPP